MVNFVSKNNKGIIMKKIVLILLCMTGFVSSGHAELFDNGDYVYDSAQDISWLKDTNVFKTLCDADNAIASAFTPVDATDAAEICTKEGRMTWYDARAWIARLNDQNYLGVNNWRLPVVKFIPDFSCIGLDEPAGTPEGFQCIGSEIGHLYKVGVPAGLGNVVQPGIDPCTVVFAYQDDCFENKGPFLNTSLREYWLGTEDVGSDPERAMVFLTDIGFQGFLEKNINNSGVWPVRDSLKNTASIKFNFGWPRHNENVVGLGMIQGYATSPNGIDRIELYQDGQFYSNMPYGGIRADIAQLYPDYSDSLNSGFALRFGFRNLSAGLHQLKLVVYDKLQNSNEKEITVNVQKYGNEWASGNDVDLTTAACRVSDDKVFLDNILINGSPYDAQLSWDTTLQSFSVKEVSPAKP